jgi:hypothetical protein
MVVRQVKPIDRGQARPPKGRLTWMALLGIALFVVLLAIVILRPVVDSNDGPEAGGTEVNVSATEAAGTPP